MECHSTKLNLNNRNGKKCRTPFKQVIDFFSDADQEASRSEKMRRIRIHNLDLQVFTESSYLKLKKVLNIGAERLLPVHLKNCLPSLNLTKKIQDLLRVFKAY